MVSLHNAYPLEIQYLFYTVNELSEDDDESIEQESSLHHGLWIYLTGRGPFSCFEQQEMNC